MRKTWRNATGWPRIPASALPPATPPRRRAGRRGAAGGRARAFTLFEVLVALAILAIMLVTMYQTFGSTVMLHRATGGLWEAIVHANNELLRWERRRSVPVSVQQGTYPPDHPLAGYTWKREIADEEPLPGIIVRKVELELTWQEGGATRSYRSSIYVPPR